MKEKICFRVSFRPVWAQLNASKSAVRRHLEQRRFRLYFRYNINEPYG